MMINNNFVRVLLSLFLIVGCSRRIPAYYSVSDYYKTPREIKSNKEVYLLNNIIDIKSKLFSNYGVGFFIFGTFIEFYYEDDPEVKKELVMIGISEDGEFPYNQKLYSLGYFDSVEFVGYSECKDKNDKCNNELKFKHYIYDTGIWKTKTVNLDSLAVSLGFDQESRSFSR